MVYVGRSLEKSLEILYSYYTKGFFKYVLC